MLSTKTTPVIVVLLLALVASITDARGSSNLSATRFLEGDLTPYEILALEAKCTCIESSLYCSDAEGLEHCHCEEGVAHCDEEEDHDHDHGHDHGDEDSANSEESKPWGIVIGMSLVVNLTTLVGIFLVGGHWGRNLLCKNWKPSPATGELWINVIIPMFASGCLMATTFFLLIPEALHMLNGVYVGDHGDHHRRLAGDHEGGDEAAATWRWGASIMGGFLIPVLLHAFFPHAETDSHGHVHAPLVAADDADDNAEVADTDAPEVAAGDAEKPNSDKTGDSDEELKKTTTDVAKTDDDEYVTICKCLRLKNLPLFISFNLGEAIHNFTDGIFIGAAYVGCGTALGNTVVIATVVHEIPNQLAGYLVMVNQNGIDPVVALLLNFLFGTAVLIGALVILLFDVGNVANACLFAIGGGIFLHVAIAEMLAIAERNVKRPRHVAYMLLSFIVGTICLGLVLIDHQHCGGH